MLRRPPLAIRAYAAAADLALPLFARRATGRLAAEGVPKTRQAERLGRATASRPPGRLVWLHGASVGEGLSVLPLIEAMGASAPDLSFLVTTGTAASAAVIEPRLPQRARHQFAPLDGGRPVQRFLRHWTPDLLVLTESEIWPRLLIEAERMALPRALVNARLSAGSLRNWGRFPAAAERLFSGFDMVAAQDEGTRDGLTALGAHDVRLTGTLKAAASPPRADARALHALEQAISGRPLWVAANTHEGEEDLVLAAHAALLTHLPSLLLILVPRHPARAPTIAREIEAHGLRGLSRSKGALPGAATQVYLADTLGETGLWYRLAPLVLMAGSFGSAGGHNPWEAAALGCALLHGPHVPNAAEAWAALDATGAAREVTGAALSGAVLTLLRDPLKLAGMQNAARTAASDARPDGLADDLARDLLSLMPPGPVGLRLVQG